jgi:hypothetical protein
VAIEGGNFAGRALRSWLKSARVEFYRRSAINNKGRFALATNGRQSIGQEQKLVSLYRISDGGNVKARFPFATKEVCLKNFLSEFAPAKDDLIIIADNVGEATWDMVNQLHPNVLRTRLDNARSWRYAAFEIAAATFAENTIVYLVEDDYLHLPGSRQALIEGMAIADYVSLYDHNDKYVSAGDGGPNPFIEHGGELTRVARTAHAHWKVTNSTTMTFATTVKVLREDRDIWERHTRGPIPNDFRAFLDLCRKSRRLVTPLPGYSTHCEPSVAAPGVDWAAVAAKYA